MTIIESDTWKSYVICEITDKDDDSDDELKVQNIPKLVLAHNVCCLFAIHLY